MTESELLTNAQCRELFEQTLRAARAAGADEVELTLGVTCSALTRFANNTIHQNVAEQHRLVSVRTTVDHRTARATTNRFDDESIRAAVAEAVANTRAQSPDPDTASDGRAGRNNGSGPLLPVRQQPPRRESAPRPLPKRSGSCASATRPPPAFARPANSWRRF